MSMATLPSTLRVKLATLSRRLAWLRLGRHWATTIGLLALAVAVFLAVDALLELAPWVRGVLGLSWLVGLCLGIVKGIQLWRQQYDAEALAALIENTYPNLAERLMTAVELAEAKGEVHGSPALIDLLIRETEIRASRLDFLQAASESPTRWRVVAGIVAVGVLLVPWAIWPQSYPQKVRRLVMPWLTDMPGYELRYSQDDLAIARGSALTLAAHLVSIRDDARVPDRGFLLVTDTQGRTKRLAMTSDPHRVFQIRLKGVTDSFRYQIQVGQALGPERQVHVVDPVGLEPDSPTVSITPPSYAQTDGSQVRHVGIVDLTCLQYSKLTYEFRFDRPAQRARVTWSSEDESEGRTHDLRLSPDGRSATFEMPAVQTGRLSLTIVGEHDIMTEMPAQTVHVNVDRPPAFAKSLGIGEQLRVVSPDDQFELDVAVVDDIGVGSASLEYRVNEGPVQTLPIPLEGRATPQAHGRLRWKLADLETKGENVQFRIRASDNRDIPEAHLGPQVVYAPAENRWFALKLSRQAQPLRQQEIVAQHDAIQKRLDELIDELHGEQRRLYKARAEAQQSARLTADVADQLQDLRKEHAQNEKRLADLSRDVDQIAGLRSLAHRLHDVGDQDMRQAALSLAHAERERQATAPRDEHLGKADAALLAAVKKLEALKQENDQLARQRQDQWRVEQLAEKQQRLAERVAAELDTAKRQELARQQEQIENELRELTRSNDTLRQAWEAAQAERAQQLSEKARELAHQQRELSQAIDQAQRELLRGELGALAERQKELAERAEKLAHDTQQAVASAQSRPLDAESARQAAKELERGNVPDALTRQEQAAQDLDRLANDLQRAIDLSRDPRVATRQLARWQKDLKDRVVADSQEAAPAKVDPERLDDWQKEQDALRQAVGRIPTSEKDPVAQKEKQEALQKASQAASDLANRDSTSAATNMEKARQALERLADRLPTMEQRWAAARDEVHRLRKDQDELTRQTEQAAQAKAENDTKKSTRDTELDKRLTDAARRQAEALDRLNALDLPGFESRQQRIGNAMERALDDLHAGRFSEATHSQAEAKRQLERLEQALNGQKPVDEKVADLASRQRSLAERVAQMERANGNAADRDRTLQQLAAEQKRLAQEAAAIPPTEAALRQDEAVDATRQAESKSRQEPRQFGEMSRQAAQRLEDWAKQLLQGESDAAKADRLAKRLRELAQQSESQRANSTGLDELRRKQQPVQDEARQIRGGSEASQEKQKAAEALAQLSRSRPEELPSRQRLAADALEQLARRLSRGDEGTAQQQSPEGTLPRTAQEFAEEQERLARQTQQARREASRRSAEQANQDAQNMARRQAQLREQTSRLPATQRGDGLEQAREAMRRAERALERGDWEQGERQQQAAAQSLKELAEAAQRFASHGSNPASRLPRSEQVEQARQLAQQQRELRDAAQRALSNRVQQDREAAEKLLRELLQEQQSIAEAASQLAQRQPAQAPQHQRANEAAQSARQAGQQLQNGAFDSARQAGETTSEQLRRLAQATEGTNALDAASLARRQDAMNQRLSQLRDNSIAQQAQQAMRQQDLQRQAQQLAEQLARQADRSSGAAQEALRQAAQSARRANNFMQQSQQRQQEGNATGRRIAQRFAARDLDQASQYAQRATGQRANEEQAPAARRELGAALQEAQAKMQDARGQLGQSPPQMAQQSMQQAAQALQQAARSFDGRGQMGQPPSQIAGEPQNDGSAAGAAIDLSRYGPDATRYKGKPWGELPGELRTRIIQDMKAQFGEDYGRMIKLYFEQMADRKATERR